MEIMINDENIIILKFKLITIGKYTSTLPNSELK